MGKKVYSHENIFVLPKTEVRRFRKRIFQNEWLHTKARIETEIKGNSKMAYELIEEGDLGTKDII